MLFSTGCFVAPVDVEPEPVLSVEIYGVAFNNAGDVCCYVKNTGDDIRFCELTFDVTLEYHKPVAPVVELCENLEAGSITKVCISFACPVCESTDIESVLITYELW